MAKDYLTDAYVRLRQKLKGISGNERRRTRTVPLEKDFVDDSPDPTDREKDYAEMNRKIQTELTETQRYILEEKEYGGRTLDDIAKELKMEPAAVRMQLSRARKTLRETLKNALKDDR